MEIGGTSLDSNSVYVIAEAGINHNGDLSIAKELIEVAADAGANAVKFQSFVADELVSETAPTADYQDDEGTTQRELLEPYELDETDHRELQAYCRSYDVTFLSTPFDSPSLSLLNRLDVPAIKVGSGELTNHPFLAEIARLGKPMIVSTGMSTMDEVERAYSLIKSTNPDVPVSLLHCVSAYPTPVKSVNLRAMQAMQSEFDCPIGFSDHTTAVEIPGIATAMGARIVEKHFTIDRSLPGPDHEASLEPGELERAIEIARTAARARGSPQKQPTEEEEETAFIARKSLHATQPIERGDSFSTENVRIARPADGVSPVHYDDVLAATADQDLRPGEPITDAAVKWDRKNE